MLKLGIESEGACNPIARAVGTEVLKTFPEEIVKQYKTTSSMQGRVNTLLKIHMHYSMSILHAFIT